MNKRYSPGKRRGIYRTIIILFFFLICCLFSFSCSKKQGGFAFKRLYNDTYRKIEGIPEFSTDEEIKWVYIFKRIRGEMNVGIIYLKKEIVWVEILSEVSRLDSENKIIYGLIKDLSAGEYQIVLTEIGNNDEVIVKKNFLIYQADENEE